MKTLMIIAATALMFSTAHASSVTEYAAEVGVQAIARDVVQKRLVPAAARATLRLALETGRATLGKMQCDRALGTDVCVMDVMVLDDQTTAEAEETLYRLEVHVIQGSVHSARWELIAG